MQRNSFVYRNEKEKDRKLKVAFRERVSCGFKNTLQGHYAKREKVERKFTVRWCQKSLQRFFRVVFNPQVVHEILQ